MQIDKILATNQNKSDENVKCFGKINFKLNFQKK